jgi:SAM-dependent methyltransferase
MTLPPAFPTLLQLGQLAVRHALENCAADPALPRLLAVDATCGNGHDTLFLAQSLTALAGDKGWAVLGLDVQEQALASTRQALEEQGLREGVALLRESHEDIIGIAERHLPDADAGLAAVMYNLGYLPRSDKRVITRKESTLPSLYGAASMLAPRGILSIHAYGGHPGGFDELRAVEDWCADLPFELWQAARYAVPNKPHAPETLFLIQKRAWA